MIRVLPSLVALTLCLGFVARADVPPSNPKLAAAMKAIAGDVGLVLEPAKKPAADVTDAMLTTAIARTRIASFRLQQVEDAKGSVAEGVLVPGAMTPPNLEKLTAEKTQEMLDLFAKQLQGMQTRLGAIENLLIVEILKDPKLRDYAQVKVAAAELQKAIGEAHKIFKPK